MCVCVCVCTRTRTRARACTHARTHIHTLQVSIGLAGKERVLRSNGVPDHFVIHNLFPLCEVAWSFAVPFNPTHAVGPCQYKAHIFKCTLSYDFLQ